MGRRGRRLQHGLETWADGENVAALPEPFLAEHDFVTAFEAGWRLLYEDVSLRVCERLIAILATCTISTPRSRAIGQQLEQPIEHRQGRYPRVTRRAVPALSLFFGVVHQLSPL